MKKFYIFSLGLLLLNACSLNAPEDSQSYETEKFSLQLPADWTTTESGSFTSSEDSNAPIVFSHVTGDIDAPIYESAGDEGYLSAQGMTWTLRYSKVRKEFIGLYSESFRFVEVDSDEESFTGSTFLYTYDEILNPDAITTLKAILDSYKETI